MLVALPHFFRLMAHVFVDDPLVNLLRCQIGGIRMSENVESPDDRPFRLAQRLVELNASLIGSQRLVGWTFRILEILTERVLTTRMHCKPLSHDRDAS